MSEIVIEIKNVTKEYRLGTVSSGLLYKDLSKIWNRLKNNMSLMNKGSKANVAKDEYIFALKNININVKRGEVLGLIGENGAGKSTLLKIISRITSPSIGEINIKGSIASLLEVGTGFHPELTGLENIYLSGAILGMKKNEIKKNLKEIIKFSGIKEFIDTPIKRYSSGMKVRLGFSVAAHLTADILLIDEVLAVGDARFQEKCLNKIDNIAKNGRTVIFVSHNMMAIIKNCTRVISFNQGEIEFDGMPKKTVENYLTRSLISDKKLNLKYLGLNNSTSIKSFNIYCSVHKEYFKSKVFPVGSDLKINLKLVDHILKKRDLLFNFEIHSMSGQPITSFGNEFTLEKVSYDGLNSNLSISFYIKNLLIMPGKYFLNLYMKDYLFGELCYLKNLVQIKIIEADIYNSGKLPLSGIQGVFITKSKLIKE